MRAAKPIPADAADLLAYNAETGELRWKVGRGSVKPGYIAGATNGQGYRQVRIRGQIFPSHRVAWRIYYGEDPTGTLDHSDGRPLNNAISNLRPASVSQNSQNQKRSSRNTTGVVGVTWNSKYQRWYAHVTIDGHLTHLGTFTSLESAAEARHKAADEHYGPFAAHRRAAA